MTGRPGSVVGQLAAFMNASPGRRTQLAAAVRAARHQAEANRSLVLAHEDLATRLIRFGYTQPAHWSGYIPPEHWNGAPNDSPARVELVALVDEAKRRVRHLRAVS